MSKKMKCREVKKLILTLPGPDDEQTLRLISEHLSECDACASLHTALQNTEAILLAEKLRLIEIARHSPIAKSRILTQAARPLRNNRGTRLRAAWVGVAAFLIAAIACASALFIIRGSDSTRREKIATPMTTWPMAAAASAQTVRELADVLRRHDAPSFEFPDARPPSPTPSFIPNLLKQCSAESEDTLKMIVQSKTNLTRREET